MLRTKEETKKKIKEAIIAKRMKEEALTDVNTPVAAPVQASQSEIVSATDPTQEVTPTAPSIPSDPYTPPAPGMIPSGWIRPEDLAAAVAMETGDVQAAQTAPDATVTDVPVDANITDNNMVNPPQGAVPTSQVMESIKRRRAIAKKRAMREGFIMNKKEKKVDINKTPVSAEEEVDQEELKAKKRAKIKEAILAKQRRDRVIESIKKQKKALEEKNRTIEAINEYSLKKRDLALKERVAKRSGINLKEAVSNERIERIREAIRKARAFKESEDFSDDLEVKEDKIINMEEPVEEVKEVEDDVEFDSDSILSKLEAFFDDKSEEELEDLSASLKSSADFIDFLISGAEEDDEECPECKDEESCEECEEDDVTSTTLPQSGANDPITEPKLDECDKRIPYKHKKFIPTDKKIRRRHEEDDETEEMTEQIKYPAGSAPEASQIANSKRAQEDFERNLVNSYNEKIQAKKKAMNELRESLRENRFKNAANTSKYDESIDKFDGALRGRGTSRRMVESSDSSSSWENNRFIDRYEESKKFDFRKALNDGISNMLG